VERSPGKGGRTPHPERRLIKEKRAYYLTTAGSSLTLRSMHRPSSDAYEALERGRRLSPFLLVREPADRLLYPALRAHSCPAAARDARAHRLPWATRCPYLRVPPRRVEVFRVPSRGHHEKNFSARPYPLPSRALGRIVPGREGNEPAGDPFSSYAWKGRRARGFFSSLLPSSRARAA